MATFETKINLSPMNPVKFISNLGIRAGQPHYLQIRIQTTNWLASLLLGACLPYVIIFQNIAPVIAQMCAGISVAYSLALLFNRLGATTAGRLIIAFVPTLMCFFIHIALITVGEKPVVMFSMIQLSLLVMPWLVLDMRETAKMVSATVFAIACVMAVQPCAGWIEVKIDGELLRNGSVNNSLIFTSCCIITVSLYLLQRNARQADLKNEKLIGVMTAKQEILSGNEIKLNEYIAEVEKSQAQDRQRQWASDGLAMFANLLRQHSADSAHLYDALISQVVKYMKASQGGLFLVQDENAREPFIEQVACYAYERKKHLKQRIEIGEGLIGQAVQENDVLYLTDVPQDYINITSGLGKASPTSILIMPLRVNDKVEGVIELASFNEFEPYQMEFLQKLGESIAASVTTTRINEKTKLLLEASQQQAEELRAQEEEMRQNMEELMATQEEMERKTNETQQLYVKATDREAQLQAQEQQMKEYIGQMQAAHEEKLTEMRQQITKMSGQLSPQ